MADHVGIREIHDREVVLPGAERLTQGVGDTGGAHLRGEVVGRDARRGHQQPLLTRERLVAAPVEEVRHVRVLLGLGDMQLAQARFGDEARDGHDRLRREGDGHIRKADLVIGERDERQPGGRAIANEPVEVGPHECPGELARTVRTEVEEDDRVAITDRGALTHDVRGEQLVTALGVPVAALQRLFRRPDPRSVGIDDGPPGQLDPVPTAIPIHRVVATVDRGDGRTDLGDELHRASRRHVAAIEERVDGDPRHAAPARELDDRGEVRHVGVNAAGGQEPHQVERPAARPGVRTRVAQRDVLVHGSAGDGIVYDVEALRLDVAGAHRQVPDLAVPHHAIREADRAAAGVEAGVGVPAEEVIEPRGGRTLDDVARTRRRDAPAVEHTQHDRTETLDAHRKARTIAANSSAFRLAPPTSAPSIPLMPANSATLLAVTLPP